ncbi:hypothetical protein LK09_16945 [Microbacterium mangrovi]|uniref:Antimicrobial peptide, SdpC family n=1 Tax=Microbacterium mangrovi TaxID=1348253 RepID=A0A0B2A364_9MICO|nr:hypothetical protein [Microbacterium mangrovi]KHK96037.1 hypothetical protein LK09_16945 [Microbacterium mangrovi]
MHTSIAALITAGALASSSLTAAPSQPQDSGADSASQVVAAADSPQPQDPKYSDADIVEFFLFGRGPAADDRPDLIESLGIVVQPEPNASTVSGIVRTLTTADPSFHERVTAQLQARDPYKAEAGMKAFASDLRGITATASASTGPRRLLTSKAVSSGWAVGQNYIALYNTAVVSVGFAVSVALVASIAGVVLAFYERPDDTSDLRQQQYAQALAGAL